jgi:hypothetical protein
MKLSEIHLKYANKAKREGSLFLLDANDAIRFIEDCASEGLKLLGVEGFKITKEGAFQPHQEHSNDIVDSKRSDFVHETKEFIREREGMGIWFEVVCSEDEK